MTDPASRPSHAGSESAQDLHWTDGNSFCLPNPSPSASASAHSPLSRTHHTHETLQSHNHTADAIASHLCRTNPSSSSAASSNRARSPLSDSYHDHQSQQHLSQQRQSSAFSPLHSHAASTPPRSALSAASTSTHRQLPHQQQQLFAAAHQTLSQDALSHGHGGHGFATNPSQSVFYPSVPVMSSLPSSPSALNALARGQPISGHSADHMSSTVYTAPNPFYTAANQQSTISSHSPMYVNTAAAAAVSSSMSSRRTIQLPVRSAPATGRPTAHEQDTHMSHFSHPHSSDSSPMLSGYSDSDTPSLTAPGSDFDMSPSLTHSVRASSSSFNGSSHNHSLSVDTDSSHVSSLHQNSYSPATASPLRAAPSSPCSAVAEIKTESARSRSRSRSPSPSPSNAYSRSPHMHSHRLRHEPYSHDSSRRSSSPVPVGLPASIVPVRPSSRVPQPSRETSRRSTALHELSAADDTVVRSSSSAAPTTASVSISSPPPVTIATLVAAAEGHSELAFTPRANLPTSMSGIICENNEPESEVKVEAHPLTRSHSSPVPPTRSLSRPGSGSPQPNSTATSTSVSLASNPIAPAESSMHPAHASRRSPSSGSKASNRVSPTAASSGPRALSPPGGPLGNSASVSLSMDVSDSTDHRSAFGSFGNLGESQSGHGTSGNSPGSTSSPEQVEEQDFECGLCLSLLCEPISIPCGHTFCQCCLVSSLERSKKQCPSCRSPCHVDAERLPVNVILANLIKKLFPIEYAKRKALADEEKKEWANRLSLFYMGDNAFPYHRIHLRLFEPRYLLMARRALTGDRRFGFMPGAMPTEGAVGVVLHIDECEFMPDGTALVSCSIRERFRLTRFWQEHGTFGLDRAQVEYFADVAPAEVVSGANLAAEADARARFTREISECIVQVAPLTSKLIPLLSRATNIDYQREYGDVPPFSMAAPLVTGEKISFYLANVLSRFMTPASKKALVGSQDTLYRLRMCIAMGTNLAAALEQGRGRGGSSGSSGSSGGGSSAAGGSGSYRQSNPFRDNIFD